MANPELGAKRQCQSCAIKFYDLKKDPIVCPKCGTIFHPAPLSRAAGRVQEEEGEIEKETPDTVSLEEVEETENPAEATEDDVEIEGEDGEDDTFLAEEEGEEDDVAGLIDGDLESDEES